MSPLATRLTGIALLVLASVWTAGAFWMIPAGYGGAPIMPRGFPIVLGLMLGLLSIVLIATTFARQAPAEKTEGGDGRRSELWAAGSTFGFLIIYTLMLGWFGFIVATAAASAAMLLLVFGSRSPLLVVGLPLALAYGIWFLIGKMLGVYLP